MSQVTALLYATIPSQQMRACVDLHFIYILFIDRLQNHNNFKKT
jgi:hypothetical protein